MNDHRIIVIGGSAGSIEALLTIVRALPAEFPAAIFVVIHRSKGPSQLVEILGQAGDLPVVYAENSLAIEAGRIYIAPGDYHLLLKPGHMELSSGPKVNLVRPAIDLLFQSAAHSYGNQVVGIILSGILDDGSRGLYEIKRLGGIAIAQDPAEAVFPQMIENAMNVVKCDYVVPASQMASLLLELSEEVRKEVPMSKPNPEVDNPHNFGDARGVYDKGKPSRFSCPDCGGVLAELSEGKLYFECRVGHQYSLQTLLEAQSDAVEAALWTALRSMEEARSYARRMAESENGNDYGMSKRDCEEKANDYTRMAETVRTLLLSGKMTSEAD
jgi:two-component system, chemotaxis family, protein-glutamate methylesterase/glutaminase